MSETYGHNHLGVANTEPRAATFGRYRVRENADHSATVLDQADDVVGRLRSWEAGVFFARAASGATQEELRTIPLSPPELIAPEPTIEGM